MQIFTGCSQVHCYDGLSVNISTLSVSTTICEIWKLAYLFCLRAWASRQDSKESGTCFVFTYQHNLLLLSAWNLCKLWQATEKQYPINIFLTDHETEDTNTNTPLDTNPLPVASVGIVMVLLTLLVASTVTYTVLPGVKPPGFNNTPNHCTEPQPQRRQDYSESVHVPGVHVKSVTKNISSLPQIDKDSPA